MLVPDVSQRSVEIYYSFSGAELLLFGAIIYPDGRPPKEPADIVVILKGPSQSITMREKQKIAGMWINAASAHFRSAPSYYAMASSRPIAAIVEIGRHTSELQSLMRIPYAVFCSKKKHNSFTF